MWKIFIKIRKKFILQLKWRLLRIFTKVIKRSKLEKLAKILTTQIKNEKDEIKKAYLNGKLDIIKLLLK